MREYITDAVVLHKEPNGDFDHRIILFTKQFGKLAAKSKSARKITSKLSGHLEPGTLAAVRLVEKNNLQVVDALKKSKLKTSLADLHFLGKLLADAEPEPHIWEALANGTFSWKETLRTLGWDPASASCNACMNRASVFHVATQEFFCANCPSKAPQEELLYV